MTLLDYLQSVPGTVAADALGVSTATVSRIKAGLIRPTSALLARARDVIPGFDADGSLAELPARPEAP